ncbi:unnamed protein product [Camellia sinensis]
MENPEESSPLIPRHSAADEDEKRATKPTPPPPPPPPAAAAEKHSPQAASGNPYWTADGLPLGHGSVMGEPMRRAQWDSSLFACLGRNDEFCSSDLEVCLLGSVAPCVLYGSNVERLGAGPGTFANHCLPYSSLFLIGNSIFGSNCLAPWFSYPSRTAIRRKFNLERAPARHLPGHVDAAEISWMMRCTVSNASQLVTLQLISSAMHVHFARKVVSSVVGFLILGLMPNPSCLCTPLESRPWVVVGPEKEGDRVFYLNMTD